MSNCTTKQYRMIYDIKMQRSTLSPEVCLGRSCSTLTTLRRSSRNERHACQTQHRCRTRATRFHYLHPHVQAGDVGEFYKDDQHVLTGGSAELLQNPVCLPSSNTQYHKNTHDGSSSTSQYTFIFIHNIKHCCHTKVLSFVTIHKILTVRHGAVYKGDTCRQGTCNLFGADASACLSAVW